MSDIQLKNALAKAAPSAAGNALKVIPDDNRYKFKFEVAGSTGRVYRISFDISRLCWVCSCPGCIGHQKTCKHLGACGLRGPDGGKQVDFAKKHGFMK